MVRIQSYSKLIKTTVIIGDTLLCGVIFELFCFFLAGTHWEKILSAPKARLYWPCCCAMCCAAWRGRLFCIKGRCYGLSDCNACYSLNVFYFAVLSGAILTIGQYMDVWSLFLFGLYHRTVCLYRVFQIAFAFFHQEFPCEREESAFSGIGGQYGKQSAIVLWIDGTVLVGI